MDKVDLGAVSAYAIAVKNGFKGTEVEWLASLKPDITMDATPTDGSENPVTSDGIKQYVDNSTPSPASINSMTAELFNSVTLIGTYNRKETTTTTAEKYELTLSETINNFVMIYIAVVSATYFLGSTFVPVNIFKLGQTLELNCINDQQSLFGGNAKYASDTVVSGKVVGKTPTLQIYGIGRIAGG